jgi:CheY-like chemotaxis protein
MPGQGGLKITQHIRSEEQHKTTKSIIVAMTAHSQEGQNEKCLAAGMDDFLAKPIVAAVLESTLLKWIAFERANDSNKDSSNLNTSDHLIDYDMFNELKKIFSGSSSSLTEVFETFLRSLPHNVSLLKLAQERQDLVLASRIAHTIKGSASSVGSIAIKNLAKEL